MILRVQDSRGRGPWRPGLSSQWCDNNRDFGLPAIFVDLPDFSRIVQRAYQCGLHFGCATRQERFCDWFTPREQARLAVLGFHVADASRAEILAETINQVLIGSPRPLWKLPRVSFPGDPPPPLSPAAKPKSGEGR